MRAEGKGERRPGGGNDLWEGTGKKVGIGNFPILEYGRFVYVGRVI